MNSILTVLTASNTYDLTILATVKADLGLTDHAQDEQLDSFIDRASAAIANYCNRVFALESVREEFWPERSVPIVGSFAPLQLKRWPIAAVTLVTEDGDTLVENTDFRVDAAKGQLIRIDDSLYPTSWPSSALLVEYSAGYALLDGLPWALEDATIRLVKKAYFGARRDPSIRQESIPGVRDVSYWIATGEDAGNLPPDVVDLINDYRVPVVA